MWSDWTDLLCVHLPDLFKKKKKEKVVVQDYIQE